MGNSALYSHHAIRVLALDNVVDQEDEKEECLSLVVDEEEDDADADADADTTVSSSATSTSTASHAMLVHLDEDAVPSVPTCILLFLAGCRNVHVRVPVGHKLNMSTLIERVLSSLKLKSYWGCTWVNGVLVGDVDNENETNITTGASTQVFTLTHQKLKFAPSFLYFRKPIHLDVGTVLYSLGLFSMHDKATLGAVIARVIVPNIPNDDDNAENGYQIIFRKKPVLIIAGAAVSTATTPATRVLEKRFHIDYLLHNNRLKVTS